MAGRPKKKTGVEISVIEYFTQKILSSPCTFKFLSADIKIAIDKLAPDVSLANFREKQIDPRDIIDLEPLGSGSFADVYKVRFSHTLFGMLAPFLSFLLALFLSLSLLSHSSFFFHFSFLSPLCLPISVCFLFSLCFLSLLSSC